MAVSATRPSVGTTVTALSTGGETDFTSGHSIVVFNPGPTTVAVGGANVAAATGYELATGAAMTADLGRGEALYAIVASGTQTVHVLQVGV